MIKWLLKHWDVIASAILIALCISIIVSEPVWYSPPGIVQ